MRILVDAHVFEGKFQGSRTYIKGLYSELIQLRPDWEFYLAGYNLNILEKEFGDANNINFVQLRHRNKFTRLFFEFPQIIRKYKIDYSHFQYISPPIKVGKYIVTTHDILFEEKRFQHFFPKSYKLINGKLFKRSAKSANILLTVSNYSKEKISELYKIDSNKIFVTPNAVTYDGIDLSRDNYIKDKFGVERYLLYVSRIEPRKNHISILKAFINLSLYEQGFQIVFIGNQDIDDPELNAYLKKHQTIFDKHLHQFKVISGIDLQKFYINAELVVYPSYAEGFGIPPLEAAIYKSKVLCSNATAMKEFDFFEFQIDPGDQHEIENAIQRLLENEVDVDKIHNIILERYKWNNAAKVLEKALISDGA